MIIPSEPQRPAITLKGVRRRSTLIWGWLRCPSHLKMPLKNIKTHEERVQARTKYFYPGPFGSVKSSFRKIENLQIPFRSAFIITEQSFITCRWLAWMLCDVVKQKVSLLHNWYIKGGVRWVLKQGMEKLRFIWKSFNAKNRLLILLLLPGHLQSVDLVFSWTSSNTFSPNPAPP